MNDKGRVLWQRALCTTQGDFNGETLWVKAQPPEHAHCVAVVPGAYNDREGLFFETHLLDENLNFVRVAPEEFELLNEFSHDVQPEMFETWLRRVFAARKESKRCNA